MSASLGVVMNGNVIGHVTRDTSGRVAFEYDDSWRHMRDAIPLSLSMPLTRARHGHDVVDPFLWGLLPDNEKILARWGTRFHVSARDAYGLLAHVGEDCAGAVQFIADDRVATLADTATEDIEWLDDREIGQRLAELRDDPAAGRHASDHGQFSLAGAQPKTALLLRDGRWGIPSGRIPTTHILKPPGASFDGHAEN
jgi:serine/threonine-protein kinase HipA